MSIGFTDPPPNAVQPTGGQGLVLTPRGKIPTSVYSSGSAASGQVLVADGAGNATFAVPAALGGYEAVTKQITTNTSTSSTTDVDLLTFSAVTLLAADYYLEIAFPNLRSDTVGSSFYFKLKEGSTQIGNTWQTDYPSAAGGIGSAPFLRLRFTASAGSHTYKVTWRTDAPATISVVANGVAPCEFRIVKA